MACLHFASVDSCWMHAFHLLLFILTCGYKTSMWRKWNFRGETSLTGMLKWALSTKLKHHEHWMVNICSLQIWLNLLLAHSVQILSVKAGRRQLQYKTFRVKRSLQLPQQTSFLSWSILRLRGRQISCLILLYIQLHLHHWDKEGTWQLSSKAQINLFLINVHLHRTIGRDQVTDKHSYVFTNTGTHWRTPHWWTKLISVEKQCHPFKCLCCSVWAQMVWCLRAQPSTKQADT